LENLSLDQKSGFDSTGLNSINLNSSGLNSTNLSSTGFDFCCERQKVELFFERNATGIATGTGSGNQNTSGIYLKEFNGSTTLQLYSTSATVKELELSCK